MDYKVGDVVGLHWKKDKVIQCGGFWTIFEYPENGDFRKLTILRKKKHWNYFFKTMFKLSDGFWYSEKDMTPIKKEYAILGDKNENN